VFENPQHDFPQRISYTLKGDGKLTAAIAGSKNGKTRRVEFNYQRVKSLFRDDSKINSRPSR
jgi:hypothetical protein